MKRGLALNTRLKLISFALILTLLILTLKTDTFSILLSGDPEALKDLSHGSIFMLLLFTLLLMTIQNMFTIIPLLLLISVNVSIFGFIQGYIWSWLISIAGAVISFLITRYWFQTFFTKYVNNEFKQKIEEKGFWFVFIGRILPFMPTSVVNIAAGISSIRFKKFLYATLLGNMIYFLLLSFISQGILSIPWESLLYASIAVVGLIAFVIMKLWKRKQMIKKERA
jgi:uncharacterized membrane protein YdjX (TVP38/TMEM64 family)